MNENKTQSETPKLLSREDFQMISDAFAGKIGHGDLPTAILNRDKEETIGIVLQGVTTYARDILNEHREEEPNAEEQRSTSRFSVGRRDVSFSSIASALAIGIAAMVLVTMTWQPWRTTKASRRDIAYTLSQTTVRGGVNSERNESSQEWALRVESSANANAYVVRFANGTASLERGEFELPLQKSYILRFREDGSSYFLLLLDSSAEITRMDIERKLSSLESTKASEWQEEFISYLSGAGKSWFAFSEIARPATTP